jgi:hypothetical protein
MRNADGLCRLHEKVEGSAIVVGYVDIVEDSYDGAVRDLCLCEPDYQLDLQVL